MRCLLLKFLSEHIHIVLQSSPLSASGTFSSSPTEALHPLNNNSQSLSLQHLLTTVLFPLFMFLSAVGLLTLICLFVLIKFSIVSWSQPYCSRYQNFLPFKAWVIVHCINILFSVSFSFMDGHLICFCFLAIVNNVAMTINVEVPLWISGFIYFLYIPRSGIAGLNGKSMFNFFWIAMLFSAVAIYLLTSSVYSFQLLHIHTNSLFSVLVLFLFESSNAHDCERISYCAFE